MDWREPEGNRQWQKLLVCLVLECIWRKRVLWDLPIMPGFHTLPTFFQLSSEQHQRDERARRGKIQQHLVNIFSHCVVKSRVLSSEGIVPGEMRSYFDRSLIETTGLHHFWGGEKHDDTKMGFSLKIMLFFNSLSSCSSLSVRWFLRRSWVVCLRVVINWGALTIDCFFRDLKHKLLRTVT